MMKMTLLTTLFTIITLNLKAPEYRSLAIVQGKAIRPYEAITRAVVNVESANGKYLFNAKENAVGWFGIRPIRLNDFNKRTGKSITLDQCYSYEVGEMIFLWYASQIDYRDIKAICISWNGVSKRNLYYKKILNVL